MAEKLKDIFFTKDSINCLSNALKGAYSPFDREKFLELIYDDQWEGKTLTERMRHTALCMHETLPESYPDALEILRKIIPSVRGFEALAFPDFVANYGLQDWDLSLPALGYFTKFGSSEFGIRPFLAKDHQKVMPYLYQWLQDEDENVRRLVSEGTRPRLPWGLRLEVFIKDPSPMLPLLEILKEDPSETVRRSVANHLNDISKDHPRVTLDIAERWYGTSSDIDWIVKHACRGLLKSGNIRAMRLFGFSDPENININRFSINPRSVHVGEKVELIFDLENMETNDMLVRLEYWVEFVRAKGKTSSKVFQISEKTYPPGSHKIQKRHSFQDMSTRKHYPGTHQFSIIVNGVEKARCQVELSRG